MIENSLISPKIDSTFDEGKNAKLLPELCLELLSRQMEEWPQLREGYRSLQAVREREIDCGLFSLWLQHNPGRIQSSLAAIKGNDSALRPCFLCPDRLPPLQKGILYRDHFLILCNPMPVFPSHFTLASVRHQPQAINEGLDAFLNLIKDFGPEWTLLYNGPRCGASAPDHLHFQAVPSGRMPVEKAVLEKERLVLAMKRDGVSCYRMRNMGREVILLEGDPLPAVEKTFSLFLRTLKRALSGDEEPMINVAGYRDGEKWRLMIFPRRKHRPDGFFREGDERVVVSPGVIDMSGVLITPVGKDFERLDRNSIQAIYREVSLDGDTVEKAIEAFFKEPVL